MIYLILYKILVVKFFKTNFICFYLVAIGNVLKYMHSQFGEIYAVHVPGKIFVDSIPERGLVTINYDNPDKGYELFEEDETVIDKNEISIDDCVIDYFIDNKPAIAEPEYLQFFRSIIDDGVAYELERGALKFKHTGNATNYTSFYSPSEFLVSVFLRDDQVMILGVDNPDEIFKELGGHSNDTQRTSIPRRIADIKKDEWDMKLSDHDLFRMYEEIGLDDLLSLNFNFSTN